MRSVDEASTPVRAFIVAVVFGSYVALFVFLAFLLYFPDVALRGWQRAMVWVAGVLTSVVDELTSTATSTMQPAAAWVWLPREELA